MEDSLFLSKSMKRTLLNFLQYNLYKGKLEGLVWEDRDKKIWRLYWKVHRTTKWGDPDSLVLYEWAKYKYSYIGEEPSRKELSKWKENFRNAIGTNNSIQEIKQVSEDNSSYKLFQFMDNKVGQPVETCVNEIKFWTTESSSRHSLETHGHTQSDQGVQNVPNLDIFMVKDEDPSSSQDSCGPTTSSASFLQGASDNEGSMDSSCTLDFLEDMDILSDKLTHQMGAEGSSDLQYDRSPNNGNSAFVQSKPLKMENGVSDHPSLFTGSVEQLRSPSFPRRVCSHSENGEFCNIKQRNEGKYQQYLQDRESVQQWSQPTPQILPKVPEQIISYTEPLEQFRSRSPIGNERPSLEFHRYHSECKQPHDALVKVESVPNPDDRNQSAGTCLPHSLATFIINNTCSTSDNAKTSWSPGSRTANVHRPKLCSVQNERVSSGPIPEQSRCIAPLSVSVYYSTIPVKFFTPREKFKICFVVDEAMRESIINCCSQEKFGPIDASLEEFPHIQPKMNFDEYTSERIQKVLDKCYRGVFVWLQDDDIYAKRFCKSGIEVSTGGCEPSKLERSIGTKVFDFQHHFLTKFGSDEWSTLEPDVKLNFGVRSLTTSEKVSVVITHIKAKSMLQKRKAQELTPSIEAEIGGSLSNEFDTRLTIEHNLKDKP